MAAVGNISVILLMADRMMAVLPDVESPKNMTVIALSMLFDNVNFQKLKIYVIMLNTYLYYNMNRFKLIFK